ncbi:hypothetical protein T5B8_07103 [Salinisphaera sp. T5B8]
MAQERALGIDKIRLLRYCAEQSICEEWQSGYTISQPTISARTFAAVFGYLNLAFISRYLGCDDFITNLRDELAFLQIDINRAICECRDGVGEILCIHRAILS